jgi:lipopolysaccharide transport system permease protein
MIRQNRNLFYLFFILTVRDIVGRYKGSFFGLFWALILPIAMLAVYTFVFSGVFGYRLENSDLKVYPFSLYAGLLLFNFCSEAVTRSTMVIVSNPNYVKKVFFPVVLLPLVVVGASFVHLVIGLIVFFLAYVFIIGTPPLTIFLIPSVIFPFAIFVLGISYFVASIGVYFRDLLQLVPIIMNAMLFISPVFYPADAVPINWTFLIQLNPLTAPIEMLRALVIFGRVPDIISYAIQFFLSCLFFLGGFLFFRVCRRGFSDVL